MSILSHKEIIIRILEGEKGLLDEGDTDISNKIDELQKRINSEQENKINTIDDFKDESKEILKIINEHWNSRKYKREKIYDKIEDFYKLPYEDKLKWSENDKLPIFIDDFKFKNLQGCNYDLRLGGEVYTTADNYPKTLASGSTGDTVRIEPGEFGVFLTHEYIYIPDDLLGLISLKSKYKMKGLVNVSGFHVDPGYHGKILFSVYNTGPSDIFLRYKGPVFMIMFDKLEKPVLKGYEGKEYKNIPVEIISSLRGSPVSLKDLADRVHKLETKVSIYWAIVVTIIIGILLLLLKLLGNNEGV